jgi:hypothetical protein
MQKMIDEQQEQIHQLEEKKAELKVEFDYQEVKLKEMNDRIIKDQGLLDEEDKRKNELDKILSKKKNQIHNKKEATLNLELNLKKQ